MVPLLFPKLMGKRKPQPLWLLLSIRKGRKSFNFFTVHTDLASSTFNFKFSKLQKKKKKEKDRDGQNLKHGDHMF